MTRQEKMSSLNLIKDQSSFIGRSVRFMMFLIFSRLGNLVYFDLKI